MISILDWVGWVTSVIFLLTLISGIYAWIKGILPALIRLGNGLASRKIAIFAKGDQLRSLEDLLVGSKLFQKKNLIGISSESDFDQAERATLFLVVWQDWQDHLTDILNAKRVHTALVVYAPPGSIPPERMKDLDGKRNVIVVNFRGRLLNDIVTSLMTTGYQ
jgi:hypothetical protein